MKSKFSKKELMLIIAIVCSATALWPDTINSVSLPGIYAEFSDASPMLQSYIVSGGFFVSIPVLLCLSAISSKISKKTLLLFGVLLGVVGGTGGAFAPNLLVFAVFRSMACASSGIIMSAGYSLIFETFPNPQNSASVMGTYMTFNMAYGTLLGLVAGAVYNFGWRATQFLNAIPILSVVMILLFVPKSSSATAQAEAGEEGEYRENTDTMRLIHALTEMFCFHFLCFIYYYFVSLYADERGIGTAAVLGVLASCLTAGAVLVNMAFSKLFGQFQRYFGALCAMLCGIVTIILGFDVPTWMVIAITLVVGICNGGMSTFFPLAINQYVATSKMVSMQAITQCLSLGSLAICSYAPPVIMAIFNCGYQGMIMIVGIVIFVLSLADLLLIKSVILSKR